MDFKKLSSGAGTLFNRAKQFTGENLGFAEKTEFDESFQALLDNAEKTKSWTEKIMKQMEAFLQPNPTIRVEEKMAEKLQGYKAARQLEVDILGTTLIEAGNDLSTGAPSYGSALIKVGEVQQKIGGVQREFIQSTVNNFLNPLQSFLDGDLKVLQKERSVLETKRLDLDAAKAKVKRAKHGTAEQAEAEQKTTQDEYDKHLNVCRLLLQDIANTHTNHLQLLMDFVEAQTNCFAQCHKYMSELKG